jgi:hypothetical protein
MKPSKSKGIFFVIAYGVFSTYSIAEDKATVSNQMDETSCKVTGPQAPRDIDKIAGKNNPKFSLAPSYKNMNLCNIHFHNNAEHKAKDFSIYVGEGNGGYGGGYQCGISDSLTTKELKATENDVCKGLKPGDTVEVHWAHTSCKNAAPGDGLGSCIPDGCTDYKLRVESQVFTLVNDASAINFNELSYTDNVVNGLHQAKSIPANTGKPAEFLGSVTGPDLTNQICSPLLVSWGVRPRCSKLDINSLGKWCKDKDSVFNERRAHGVRMLVTNPNFLSEIK